MHKFLIPTVILLLIGIIYYLGKTSYITYDVPLSTNFIIILSNNPQSQSEAMQIIKSLKIIYADGTVKQSSPILRSQVVLNQLQYGVEIINTNIKEIHIDKAVGKKIPYTISFHGSNQLITNIFQLNQAGGYKFIFV